MAEILVIRLHSGAATQASWVIVDSMGARLGPVESGPIAAASGQAQHRKVLVLVPGADVLLTSANLPVRSAVKLLQAVPFALEEHLADDVDRLHFAVGNRDQDGKVAVAVVAGAKVEQWLSQLRDAGIEPQSMLSETEGVPIVPGSFAIVMEDGRIQIRTPDREMLALDGLSLSEAADVLGIRGRANESEEPPPPVSALLAQEDYERSTADIDRLREAGISLDVKLLPDGALPHLAVNAASGQTTNLLQGEYAPASDAGNLWRPWRLAASLFIGLFVTVLATKALQLQQLKAEEAHLEQSMAALLKETCPEVQRVVSAADQMAQCAGGLGGSRSESGHRFLQTLNTLGSVMAETPETRIEALSYRNDIMDLRLEAPNVDALDKIQRLVADRSDFEVKIQSATPKESIIESRIQLVRKES